MYSKENKKRLKELQKKIKYRFRKIHRLYEALAHTSYVNENLKGDIKSNETLEFLGDSVVGLIIAEYLYKKFPEYAEGRLSILKSMLVNEETLGGISRELGLGQYLIFGKGEDKGNVRNRVSVLSNALEALIGAVYIDGGIKAASSFIKRIYNDRMKNMPSVDIFGSPKNKLQHYTQTRFGSMPVYKVLSEIGPSHNRIYEVSVSFNKKVYGTGSGTSKKRAEQQAASHALDILENPPHPNLTNYK